MHLQSAEAWTRHIPYWFSFHKENVFSPCSFLPLQCIFVQVAADATTWMNTNSTSNRWALIATDNRLMSWHSEGESHECVGEGQRLGLPAGRRALNSACLQTHLLTLFNVPFVQRDGLLLPLAPESREAHVTTRTLSQINLLSELSAAVFSTRRLKKKREDSYMGVILSSFLFHLS